MIESIIIAVVSAIIAYWLGKADGRDETLDGLESDGIISPAVREHWRPNHD